MSLDEQTTHVPEDDAVVVETVERPPEVEDRVRYVVSCNCVECALSVLEESFDDALADAKAHIEEKSDRPDGLSHEVDILPSPYSGGEE